MEFSEVVETARTYYNSNDADAFYAGIWGGEDIHIGLYEGKDDSIFDASRRTVERIAEKLKGIGPDDRALDIGAGYGGAGRYLAKRFGCRVECLNLSEVQNDRNRELNDRAGLAELIKVTDGSFEEIPAEDSSFNVVWSQDAMLHSGRREQTLREVARVLKPGGVFAFTDIMQSDDCPLEELKPVLERIHLDSLGSPSFYRETLAGLGFTETGFEDLSFQLPEHYARVHAEILRRREELEQACSREYTERMLSGLEHWVNNGRKGNLKWGIFQFRKN